MKGRPTVISAFVETKGLKFDPLCCVYFGILIMDE